MSRIIPKPQLYREWSRWADQLVAFLEKSSLKLASRDYLDGSILAPAVKKDEIIEINNSTAATFTQAAPTGGTAYGDKYIEFTANGGEFLVIVECEITVTGYNDLNFGKGPDVELSLDVSNETDASGYTTVKTRRIALQPDNLGATIDYEGTGIITAYVQPSDTPNFDKGETIRVRLQGTVNYNGAATTCTLNLVTADFHVEQLQEAL